MLTLGRLHSMCNSSRSSCENHELWSCQTTFSVRPVEAETQTLRHENAWALSARFRGDEQLAKRNQRRRRSRFFGKSCRVGKGAGTMFNANEQLSFAVPTID